MISRFASLLLLLILPSTAPAASTPVRGEFELSEFGVSCPANPPGCWTCVNDALTTDDHRLVLALGVSYAALQTTGVAEGVLRPFLLVDGVRLDPPLFPCGATLHSGLRWLDRPLAPGCGGTPVGFTYRIGSAPEVTVSGDGNTFLVIGEDELAEIPFRFDLCSEFVHWGAGCGISGSSQFGFRLETPGAIDALEVAAGDAAPVSVQTSGFGIDVAASSGGRVSVSRVAGADPPGVSAVEHLHGYWDVHTDLTPGSYEADVTLRLDANLFPPEVNPAGVVVGVWDPGVGTWRPLPTDVDLVAGTATATTTVLSKFVLVESAAVTAGARSWGAVKAGF